MRNDLRSHAARGRHSEVEQLAKRFKERLIRESNLQQLAEMPRPQLRQFLESHVTQMLEAERVIISRSDKQRLLTLIIDETAGLGPLEPLMRDPSITEVMVNGPSEVYVERNGKIELTDVRFVDERHVRHIIDRIIAPIGRRIDESSPMVDARLENGDRVNAVIAPVALNGPMITIRRFRTRPWTLEDLVGVGALTSGMAQFLTAAVAARLNILISGGTGSGKTTLLSAIASHIPAKERIIVMEDMAELRLDRRHVLYMEGRPPNVEGLGQITIRHLVRNALRMRPDRIIVGEVRGDEALDMLQAMNTGHEGSLTTIHANSTAEAFDRLEAMVIMAGTALTVDVIRRHLVGALDLVVQVERLPDGQRKVVAVSEVVPGADGAPEVKDLFAFRRRAVGTAGTVDGEVVPAGRLPHCWQRLQTYGVAPPPEIFEAAGGQS